MGGGARQAQASSYADEVVDRVVHIRTIRKASQFVGYEGTFLITEASGEEKSCFFTATTNGQVMRLGEAILKNKILPICVHVVGTWKSLWGLSRIGVLLIGNRDEVFCVEKIQAINGRIDTYVYVVAYASLVALLSALGCDQDHSIGSTRSENRSG